MTPSGFTAKKLEYTKTGYDTEDYLSGSKNHKISKILYEFEEQRPYDAAVATLHSYDSILYFALSLPLELRNQAFEKFRKQQYSRRIAAIKILGEIPGDAMKRFYINQKRLVEDFRGIEK